jgi:hypothetical protein
VPVSGALEFQGQVTSGRGWATRDLKLLENELDAVVGGPLSPGSLNVVLGRPLRLQNNAAFNFDRERRMLWPACLNGLDVWVYRWNECPFHVVEIISAFKLRDRLKLRDGDPVVLQLSDEKIASIRPLELFVWAILWLGRRNWYYTNRKYYNFCRILGIAQQRPAVKGLIQMSVVMTKEIKQRRPRFGALLSRIGRRLRRGRHSRKYLFSRVSLDDGQDAGERQFRQVLNVVNFTKTSNSSYAASDFAAAYHTIDVNVRRVAGQRDPAKRLALVPVDFHGKTVLDLGCNQGGMIHQLAKTIKWGVGIDYDPAMVNAANRIKHATDDRNTSFYVLDLQQGPLELISDFLPEPKADICFLLSVCMWLDNWREVIDFARSKSHAMLFETNGSDLQQQEQIAYLKKRYRSVELLSETSEDDLTQKRRKLFYLRDPS